MRVYSPSQTTSWLRCPLKRALEQQGWRQNHISKRDIGAILGQAFGAGVEHHYKRECGIVSPSQLAMAATQSGINNLIRLGCSWLPGDDTQATTLPALAAKAVDKYIAHDPLPPTWTILDIQRTLPDHGNCRIDLGVRSHTGQLGVLDFKFKRNLKAEYRTRELEDYRESWQFKHYAWAYGEAMGEPVQFYGVILTCLEPRFEVIFDPVPVDPEMLTRWLTGARRVWAQMEKEDAGEAEPWEAASHRDQYGRCEFFNACFLHRLHPHLMETEYVRETK